MSEMQRNYDNLNDRHDRFTNLLLASRRRICGFILALVPNSQAADDIFQEVASVLWRKFDSFEPGTDFGAWALKIARLSVLEHHRRSRRLPLQFTDETLAALCDAADTASGRVDDLRAALRRCVKELSETQRTLLAQRYDQGLMPTDIARRTDRAPQTVYRALQSVHSRLFECIQRAMGEETA